MLTTLPWAALLLAVGAALAAADDDAGDWPDGWR
jgi:hypothetical protein